MSEQKSLKRVDEGIYRALVEKCQDNGWLKLGGYAWQDDPYLEEYPYSFTVVDDVESLRDAFASGNWSLRQGFVYEDLAFIQQVDGGDEWWTLKLSGGGTSPRDWVDFESWSFGPSARREGPDAVKFTNYIRSMQMATPSQCGSLDYSLDGESPAWDFSKTNEIDFGHRPVECRSFRAETPGYALSVYERPSFPGWASELFDKAAMRTLDFGQGAESALNAANALVKKAAICEANGVHTPERLRDCIPLELRAALSTQCARHINHPDRHPEQSRKAI